MTAQERQTSSDPDLDAHEPDAHEPDAHISDARVRAHVLSMLRRLSARKARRAQTRNCPRSSVKSAAPEPPATTIRHPRQSPTAASPVLTISVTASCAMLR